MIFFGFGSGKRNGGGTLRINGSQGAVVSPVSWSACEGMPGLDKNLADVWRSKQPTAGLPMVSGAHALAHDV